MTEKKDVAIIDNWIAGKHEKPSTNSYMDVTNPANGEVIAKVALSEAKVVPASHDAV